MIKKIVLGLIFRVPRKIVPWFIIIVILGFGYNLIIRIMESAKSGERLSRAADVVYQLEAKNRELKDKLSRIQSPMFFEEAIRNKLGFARKGETVVIIPEEKLKLVLGTSSSVEKRLTNWLGWWKVFF